MVPPEQRIGQLLGGKYRLQELLALGGMGIVYGARNEATGRAVAIKIMRPELAARPDFVRRVSAEARLAVEASHPNVVEVLDAGTDEFDVPYLVLERLHGQPLDALLHRPLPLLAATQALMPVLNALSALHRAGIVHRDLKPSNLFLSRSPEGRVTPKLLDFGIAKALQGAGATSSSTALGTPAYMAPEQALGCPSGPFTDVWSIAVVFVRCLTGRLPFEGAEGSLAKLRAGLRALDLEGVPEPIARVLVRALQLEPGDRPSSMTEFRAELLASLREADSEQRWPDESTVSYASDESELSAASAGVGEQPAPSAVHPSQAPAARVRVRQAQTRTLSRLGFTRTTGAPRAKALGAGLALLLLVVGGAALLVSLPRREAVPSIAVPLPASRSGSEAPRSREAVIGAAVSAGLPALGSPTRHGAADSDSSRDTSPEAHAAFLDRSSIQPSAPPDVSAVPDRRPSSAAPEAPSVAAPPGPKARRSRELREASSAASEAPRLGANRSPIIEWSAQN